MTATRSLLFTAGLLVTAFLAGCGGGGTVASTAASGPVTSAAANVQAIVVDLGPAASVNVPFTAVTICVPGTSICQTIEHILVDTGSSGLRIVSSVLAAPAALPQQVDVNGQPLAECAQFADGFSWGSLKFADVNISGEFAGSMPVQVIDNTFAVPSSCSSAGVAKQTVQDLGANGILGIGMFVYDCGDACVSQALPGIYYVCSTMDCQPVAQALAAQVQNPVASFANDNNGTIIQLAAVPPGGTTNVQGALIFGIGTQSNNAVGAATVITVHPQTGEIVTQYNNHTFQSFVDSGSNALFFPDPSIPVCSSDPGFYCPAAPLNLTATLQGFSGGAATINFNVISAATLFNNANNTAFAALAGPSIGPQNFDWGLPFFFGRSVYTALEGRNTSSGPGPYIAF
jgi:Protein of unknown function (DUF3443)